MLTSKSLPMPARLLYFATLFSALIALVPFATQAQSKSKQPANVVLAPPITVTAPTMTTTTNSTFDVNISATDMTGDNITSYQFDIFFDDTKIVPFGPNFGCTTTGTITPPSWFLLCNVTPSNRLRVSVSDFLNTPLSGAGTILKIKFQTVPGVVVGDVSPLQFVPVSLRMFTTQLTEIASIPVDGQVTIVGGTAAGADISGRVINQAGWPISKVRLFLRDGNGHVWVAVTSPFGYYRFQDIPTGETYLLAADSKRYTFQPRTISFGDEMTNLDIIANQ